MALWPFRQLALKNNVRRTCLDWLESNWETNKSITTTNESVVLGWPLKHSKGCCLKCFDLVFYILNNNNNNKSVIKIKLKFKYMTYALILS
jgi:hypothetical protein